LPILRELVASHGSARAEAAAIRLTEKFAASDPVFAGHFPGHPIVPGVLLVERVEAALAGSGRRVVELKAVKFHATAIPGQTLDFRIVCTGEDEARFEIGSGATIIASGSCKVGK
jgi:3-hydroxyacyl-[acyl-carrier-protein] dehydratase